MIQTAAESLKASGHGVAEKHAMRSPRQWLIPLPVLEIGASHGEDPMEQIVDVYVCEPEVGINLRRGAVFIQFQIMDGEAQEGTARSHTVLMPVPDAMQLLQTLQHMQKRFSLPEEVGDLAMIEIPQKKN